MHLQLGELVVDRGGEPLDYLLLLSYAPAPLGTCSCERKTTRTRKKSLGFLLVPCLAHARQASSLPWSVFTNHAGGDTL